MRNFLGIKMSTQLWLIFYIFAFIRILTTVIIQLIISDLTDLSILNITIFISFIISCNTYFNIMNRMSLFCLLALPDITVNIILACSPQTDKFYLLLGNKGLYYVIFLLSSYFKCCHLCIALRIIYITESLQPPPLPPPPSSSPHPRIIPPTPPTPLSDQPPLYDDLFEMYSCPPSFDEAVKQPI